MARSLNSKCDFDNRFFPCNLPEDAVLLVLKVKTKTGNHMLVEDPTKLTEKFRPWKKPTKDGKTSPRILPGVLSPRKNDRYDIRLKAMPFKPDQNGIQTSIL